MIRPGRWAPWGDDEESDDDEWRDSPAAEVLRP